MLQWNLAMLPIKQKSLFGNLKDLLKIDCDNSDRHNLSILFYKQIFERILAAKCT